MLDRIFEKRVLVAATVPSVEMASPLARALLAGGLGVMEVTFRNLEAPRCIERIRAEVPEMRIGVGTLLTPMQVRQAVNAGAQFGVTPGFNPTVVSAARDLGLPMIPGVMTPGEMERAMEMGCPLVKFFPAEASGGVKFLRAIAGPYGHTPLRVIPLGGVGPENMREYLSLPIVAAVGGSWIADLKRMRAGNWDEITRLAAEAVALAKEK